MRTIKFLVISTFLLINFLIANETIKIDEKERTVVVDGTVNLKKGILEFAAASTKTKRDYESFILLNSLPSELNKALEKVLGTPNEKEEIKLSITIAWQKNDETFKRKLENFIKLNDNQETFKGITWVYTGGQQTENKTLAEDTNGEIVSLQKSAPGIIKAIPDYGNPYDEEAKKGFSVDEQKVKESFPELESGVSTKIQLIITVSS